MRSYSSTEIPLSLDREVTNSLPVDHYHIQGLVDAILLAIVRGRRGILCDLINEPGGTTIQPGPAFPCFVYMGEDYRWIEDQLIRVNKADDLRSYFPEHTWNHFVTRTKLCQKNYLEFDGNLCYAILLMTTIARSNHQDIHLAYVALGGASTQVRTFRIP